MPIDGGYLLYLSIFKNFKRLFSNSLGTYFTNVYILHKVKQFCQEYCNPNSICYNDIRQQREGRVFHMVRKRNELPEVVTYFRGFPLFFGEVNRSSQATAIPLGLTTCICNRQLHLSALSISYVL